MWDGPPTVRQVYALAGALCERAGEAYPQTRSEASALIERLRIENGHPAPLLTDTRLRPRLQRRRRVGRTGLRAHYWRASEVAAEIASEMR
jgi:hypothetical protein